MAKEFPFTLMNLRLDELVDFCCRSHPERRNVLTLFEVFRWDIKRKVGKGILCLL
jgi:hypothetical protein